MAGNLPRIHAAVAGDRFVVGIYLIGGNDGNNLIVPLDSAQYAAYAKLRGSLAVPADELLPVRAVKNPGEYGFHPALGEMRDLYSRGVLAVVANVGSPRPGPSESAHNYQSMAFLSGGYLTPAFAAEKAGITVTDAGRALTTAHGASMLPLDGSLAVPDRKEMADAAAAIRFRTQFPPTSLGRALSEVAALIQSARAHGVRRAILTVGMGGFDTHRSQGEVQPALFRELSSAMAALFAANEESGTTKDITVFTDSEFGRTVSPNGTGGTGHGWGNHQIVMGGAVLGGDIYGTFPDMTTAARDAAGGWVPTTSRDRYLSTVAGWAGLGDHELRRSFPRTNSDANLGFLA
ncbi:MAG TPA: DUF1501 domain-containing protein [Verrucomicrobiae bacterium]|nr:DUF1501 domain-containing protein [Verrucomicrobiae bacterium]